MGNQKYREKTDKGRQKSLSEEQISSRAARKQAAKEQNDPSAKQANRLLPSMFFAFIFLPVVAIFFYVLIVYNPAEPEVTNASNTSNEVSYEVNSQPVVPLEAEEVQGTETDTEKPAEPAVPVQEEKAEPVAEPTTEPTAEPVPEPAPTESELEEETVEEPASASKTYTVKPGETLYRIAVNNYGSGDAVDKIRQANGMNSNTISVGQTLILP